MARQIAVRRYACPSCGLAFGFDRLDGPYLKKHVMPASQRSPQSKWCPGAGMLPVRVRKSP